MTLWLWAPLGLAAMLLFWMLGAHNRLMALRADIASAWQQVEAVLRQRSAAVSKLIHLLREPLAQEHATLDALLVASTQVDAAAVALAPRPAQAARVAELAHADALLAASLGRTLALVAQRPQGTAQPEVESLLRTLQRVDTRLAFGRQLFNQAGRHYNQAARQIPTRAVARLFSFDAAGEF